ncbi:MAG: glycosyltransferase [Nitrospiraceae bacterium]|nr:MAG: glycosyltransferase [Nitrospiraceae bacterium]
MYSGKKISVVIPCYNEESQITKVLSSLPDYADSICVVDDASTDKTVQAVRDYASRDPRVVLISLEKNSGVGAAIAVGYKHSLQNEYDVTVVMAGDGQMDPRDFEAVAGPVAEGLVDYCKGNRFFYDRGLKKIPYKRLIGNFVLTALTKIVSGYWHISDTQCGYTAISKEALSRINLDAIYPRYGCPNDILTKLNIFEMRVAEVPVNPLYKVGEKSKMKIPLVILPILLLLATLFFQRMFQKYVFRIGHPLVLAYAFSALLFLMFVGLGMYIGVVFVLTGLIPKAALIVAGVTLIISLQLVLSAFTMDFEYNRRLYVDLLHRGHERSGDKGVEAK